MIEIESNSGKEISVYNNGVEVSFSYTCGFLADPTGSGKTCTMLHFIKSRYKELEYERKKVPTTLQSSAPSDTHFSFS